jgi:hypothetical protein
MRSAVIFVLLLALTAAAPRQTPQQRPGYPAGARLLIIHADDFGMSHAVNRAIIEALEHGWVTSASILVPCPWFPEAAAWARAHQDADLGIHLAVNSEWTTYKWGPVAGRSAVPSLVGADGYMPIDEDAAVAHASAKDVERELHAQVDFAKAAGIQLTHLDSHMGTLFHTQAFFDVYRRMGQAYGLPVLMERLGARGGAESQWGTHDEQDALIDRLFEIDPGVPADEWEGAYEKMLGGLPPGVYQLIVHLGYDTDEMQGATADHPNWGSAWRQHDFDMVKSAKFQQFLRDQHFTLTTWRKLGEQKK